MRARADSPLAQGELVKVERVVRACFGNRRKTIANALQSGGFEKRRSLDALSQVEISARDRAEVIAPERLLALARVLIPEAKHGTD
jgi:16S rRNA (adenine1518-N6/adenine1519-N6)-dimethyltransferase